MENADSFWGGGLDAIAMVTFYDDSHAERAIRHFKKKGLIVRTQRE